MTITTKMLQIANLSKGFDGAKQSRINAVKDVSFAVEKAEFFTLLGPSGCGKTTLLRCIAGIETPDFGNIDIGGKSVFSAVNNTNIAANRRQLGMVFQSFAIWPHMSVLENVAFGLRVVRKSKGWSKSDIHDKTMSALGLVSMESFAKRRGADLSGGQKQRLALARAIAAEPKLILLDEPLSNLDAKLRERLRFELKDLQIKLGLTFLYVTHDQHEALSLSDRIAVLNEGSVQQIGTPRQIYQKPANRFVAEFVGKSNAIAADENHLIRPEDVLISAIRPADNGWLECKFINQHYYGDHLEVTVIAKSKTFTVKVAKNFNSPESGRLFIKFDNEKMIRV